MDVLMISRPVIKDLLPMEECLPVISDCLADLARGKITLPQRMPVWLPDRRGVLGLMPAIDGASGVLGAKVISVFPENHQTPFDSHQGFVMLFESDNGRPLAILDAAEITAIRTAAASGVATRLLARAGASHLALLGCGVQAHKHLEAMTLVRPIKRVIAWDPFPGVADAFVREESGRYDSEMKPQDGKWADVRGSDIICTLTPSSTPVLFGKDISPGTHINAVGACSPQARELDTEAVTKSQMFVDHREATLCEAGDFLVPRSQGLLQEDHIRGEIGQLITKEIQGRRSSEEITLFESLGLAIEDLAAAHYVYKKARHLGLGTVVEM